MWFHNFSTWEKSELTNGLVNLDEQKIENLIGSKESRKGTSVWCLRIGISDCTAREEHQNEEIARRRIFEILSMTGVSDLEASKLSSEYVFKVLEDN